MNSFISTFIDEWRHFLRNPFKLIATVLFVLAMIYGLENGYSLFKKQNTAIVAITAQNEQKIDQILDWYRQGKRGPDSKPWINVSEPVWALSSIPTTIIKKPANAMPFSIGQAEQFAYYKTINQRSSTLDSDMSEEIANPERLMIGTVDFSFVILYLFPILAIVLLFNVGGTERDLVFIRLININSVSLKKWLLARFLWYFVLINVLIFAVMLIYVLRTDTHFGTFGSLYLLIFSYLFLWFTVLLWINITGKGSVDQAIKMASLWLLFCVLVPGTVQQVNTIKFPSNYMSDYLDAAREESFNVHGLPPQTLKSQLMEKYPKLKLTAVGKDTVPDFERMRSSTSGLANLIMKEVAENVEVSNEQKNCFIRNTSWLNPVTWWQNKINAICETDYYAYRQYRNEIQAKIDREIDMILYDTWQKIVVDEKKFKDYLVELGN